MTTTARHPHLTQDQVALFTAMVNERFAADDDLGRTPFRNAWYTISDRESFNATLDELKKVPTLARLEAQRKAREPHVIVVPVSAPGYYRNPADGTLYRLVERTIKVKWREDQIELRVQKYSEKGGLRRLSTAGELVKGSWKSYGKYDSLRLRRQIKAEWFLTVEQLAEFAYSFCGNCGRALVDGVSVAIGIGPECAKDLGHRVVGKEACQGGLPPAAKRGDEPAAQDPAGSSGRAGRGFPAPPPCGASGGTTPSARAAGRPRPAVRPGAT